MMSRVILVLALVCALFSVILAQSSSSSSTGASASSSSSTAASSSAVSSSAVSSSAVSSSAVSSSAVSSSAVSSSAVSSSAAPVSSSAVSSSAAAVSSSAAAVSSSAAPVSSSAAAVSSSAAAVSSSAVSSSAQAASSSSGAAIRATCGADGYNLSSIAGIDLVYVNSYIWTLRPCGIVYGNGTGACVGQLCQGTTVVSNYDPQTTTWYTIPGGIVQQTANGADCSGARRANMIYMCNATATTPWINSITEPYQCDYNVTIQTAAACPTASAITNPTYVGATRVSATCGGGFYDLTTLNSADIFGTIVGTNYSIRICGNTTTPSCTAQQPVSICQIAGGGIWSMAAYLPNTYPAEYTVSSNGLEMIQQTGASCGSYNRYTNVSLVCNTTATTPVLTSVQEMNTCKYRIVVQTNAVCTMMSQIVSSSSSSSAAPAAGSSAATGSSAAAGSSGSVVVVSSSSGATGAAGNASTGSDVSTSSGQQNINGAMTFSPSIIALIVAALAAFIGQF